MKIVILNKNVFYFFILDGSDEKKILLEKESTVEYINLTIGLFEPFYIFAWSIIVIFW